jgi:16S rRNA (cytosine1402-N4)-methyltransferase
LVLIEVRGMIVPVDFSHKPVLLSECIEALHIRPDGVYVDGTAGGGGHSYYIAEKLTTGRLIAIDCDTDAIKAATERLKSFGNQVTFISSNFSQMDFVLKDLGIDKVDGILLDLGVSSYQLDTPERGFSYNHDAPLDMRMSQTQQLSAKDIVNTYSLRDIEVIIRDYGEEKFARRIAQFIVSTREKALIETTFELTQVIKAAVPAAARRDGPHPSKRTFQALRIAVNSELESLSFGLEAAIHLLNPQGRLAVISFHSLEDRIVKQKFVAASKGCICAKDAPICVCGMKPVVKLISKKPIGATDEELENNPRSRSAKLRIIEKI